MSAFARDLRRLRELSGNLTYRQLSNRAHYSAAALSEAANGRKLPSLAVTAAYVGACGGNVSAWEKRWRSVAFELSETNPREAPEPVDGRAPYVGLTAFQPGDADRFFGRSRVVQELRTQVDEHRLVVVFGASGSGKSSVLRAGLVAGALARAQPVVVFAPGPHPVRELADRIAAFTGKPAVSLAAEFAAYPENLHLRVRQSLVERTVEQDLLLVVDQFEEVFTLCHDVAERAAFIAALHTAANAGDCRIRVVLGVRADFLGHCGQHPELAEAMTASHVLVGPMTADELREVIVEPAAGTGCQVENSLVTRLVSDAAAQPAVLPLVSHALLETWHRRRGLALTLAAYEEVGGVQHAIARTAEQVYLAFDPDGQRAAKQVFLRLIAVGEGTEDTKRRVGRDEVDHPEVLAKLADARLVALDRDSVELAHEALIRSWPRLGRWIAEDRDGLRVRRALTEAAQEWQSLDRDPGALYRGTRLALAREWATGRRDELTAREIDFLDTSVATDEAVHRFTRRRTTRLRQLVGLLAVLLLLASTAIVYAFRAERTATEQRNIALSRQLISEAAAIRDTNPALSVQLSLAAYRLAPLPASNNALLSTFASPYAARVETGGTALAVSPQRDLVATIDKGNTSHAVLWDVAQPHRPVRLGALETSDVMINSMAFSSDGRTIAAGHSSGKIQLWDVAEPRKPVELARLTALPNAESLAFAPGRRLLAAGSYSDGVTLWNLDDLDHPIPIEGSRGSASRVSFDANGRLMTFGTYTTEPRLWDVDDPHAPVQLAALHGAGEYVGFAASSVDGRLMATSRDDGTVQLFDVSDLAAPRVAATFGQQGSLVHAFAFSPDGRTAATADTANVVRLWDVSDPARPRELVALKGYLRLVIGLGFGRDGATLVTSTDDNVVRVTEVAMLLGVRQQSSVRSIAFAATRPLAAVLHEDGTASLHEVVAGRSLGTPVVFGDPATRIAGLAFRPDGQALVTVSDAGVVQVWDVTDAAHPKEITAQRAVVNDFGTNGINSVVFSPNGKLLAVAVAEGNVELWDTTTLRRLTTLTSARGRGDPAIVIRFDSGGGSVVAARIASGADVWDVRDPRAPTIISPTAFYPGEVSAMVLAPRQTLVTANDDGVRYWRRPGAGPLDLPREAKRVDGGARALTIDGDGGVVVIGGVDGLVRLWSTAVEPRELAVLSGHTGTISSVAYAPDGHTLVSTGNDGTVRFWETDTERVATRICDTAYPRISTAEWEQHFPGLDYDPPCGR